MTTPTFAYTAHFPDVMRIMTRCGLLIGSYDPHGKPNLMTIGWGSLGSIWDVPVWTILLRPSRYTFQCIEHSSCFTVNVPGPGMENACTFCGSHSGKTIDKFQACALTAVKAGTVHAPVVAQSPLVYECQVTHRKDIEPDKTNEVLTGDDARFVRIYFARILAIRSADGAAGALERASP